MRADPPPRSLSGWYVISLRPQGQHAGLRRAAAALGARTLALSPLRIEARGDHATRQALAAALAADRVVFTSPNAVRAAAALRALRPRRGQPWLAVGEGTASALRRAGVGLVTTPARMDSDGLLALPALQDVRGRAIGLVTAPGGRDRLAPALRACGADVVRADVYARVAVAPSARAVARLRALRAPLLLALSSGDALAWLLGALPADAAALLREARVLAASPRLAALARDHGFGDVAVADGASPRALLAAAVRAAAQASVSMRDRPRLAPSS